MIRRASFKTASLASIILLAAAVLAGGCGNNSKIQLSEDKVNVVASFYPLYDFALKIGGEHVHAVSATPSGVEPHDWEPKSMDISQILKADLFVYQGAGLEGWVEELLKSKKPNAKVVEVEASAGLELIKAEEEHEDGHGEEGEHEDEDGEHGHDHGEFDPHAWLSPANAKKMAENIKAGLVKVDAAHQADYEANYKKLSEQLDQLDRQFKEELGKVSKKDVVVSHKAFAYLCRDYGLNQKPIMGLAPDSEPTAQDMKEINHFVKDNNVKYIFFEELVSDKLAKTLANDLKIETMVLNPLEGLTEQQIKDGDDYFSVMKRNLQNLVKALQ
ncbi:MAG: adcA [Paenibacillaceae bacterium]|jgi:zinc transport system substrate-binding protein|nr:adcA [Paenibacillaceae bacterium]